MKQLKQDIRDLILSAGATKVGFAKAEPVDDTCTEQFLQWLDKGMHGEMKYLENHHDIRQDPRLLLDGAKTIISIAFNYYPSSLRANNLPYIAMYAYGKDYHDVIRELLRPVCARIKNLWGAETRICVDSAPIHERYWAWRAGLGYQGINGTFILPGRGSYFFLAEIITTLEIEPDTPMAHDCGKCGRCIRECPAKAILGNGCIDASRCLSYLTIECRSDWQAPTDTIPPLYGCDCCQIACHHNRSATPTEIAQFAPTEEFMQLDSNKTASMSEDDFRRIFRNSAIKRTKHSGLIRNISKLNNEDNNETDFKS